LKEYKARPTRDFLVKLNETETYLTEAEWWIEKEDDNAFPCGLTAATHFTDRFTFRRQFIFDTIPIDSDDIAWPSDIDYKFKNLGGKDTYQKQWTDIEDEHFIVWMRLAPLPTFRKFYGRIEEDLDEGDYIIVIQNNYDVSEWDGEKHFVLTTTNPFGGNNEFLGGLMIGASLLCVVVFIVIALLSILNKDKVDFNDLTW
jgi:hypothetical protein